MSDGRDGNEPLDEGRYRYAELNLKAGPVGLIRDSTNDRAWIHSTVYGPVER